MTRDDDGLMDAKDTRKTPPPTPPHLYAAEWADLATLVGLPERSRPPVITATVHEVITALTNELAARHSPADWYGEPPRPKSSEENT